MSVRYVPNHTGMTMLGLSPKVGAACVKAGERGKLAAVAEAERFAKTHRYARSFDVQAATVAFVSREHGPQVRAGAVLTNDAIYAATLEWQYRKHVLAHAIAAIEKGSL